MKKACCLCKMIEKSKIDFFQLQNFKFLNLNHLKNGKLLKKKLRFIFFFLINKFSEVII